MPEIRDDIKQACSETGHSIADLAREAGLLYPRLSGAVNGYWMMKPVEDERIRKIISQWREIKQTRKQSDNEQQAKNENTTKNL